MRVAVLTLTRDRLGYTQHCFASLRENAGCEYDHYVLDQGSTDGTQDWLWVQVREHRLAAVPAQENVGISRGMNTLLDWVGGREETYGFKYDVVVTFDNDCEVVMEGTLAACAEVARHGDWIVSPTVQGLNHPPHPNHTTTAHGALVGTYWELGGIFRVMPGEFARTFRFSEDNPPWGWDERDVGRAARERGLGSGYLLDWHVNHYETTRGQEQRYPDYFERKFAEMKW